MCDELSRSLTPRLQAAGFTPPGEPFSRDCLKYEFSRPDSNGAQVLEILFNKYRKPLFWVQIYIAPSSGLSRLMEDGGTLLIGNLSASPRQWPFPLLPFRAEPTRLQRLLGQRGERIQQSVESFLSLLPEIEEWWTQQRSTPHITMSRLTVPGARGRGNDRE